MSIETLARDPRASKHRDFRNAGKHGRRRMTRKRERFLRKERRTR